MTRMALLRIYSMVSGTVICEKIFSSVHKAKEYAENNAGRLVTAGYVDNEWRGYNDNYKVKIRSIDFEE